MTGVNFVEQGKNYILNLKRVYTIFKFNAKINIKEVRF